MLLSELIKGLNVALADPRHGSNRICDVTEDSRTVLPGSLFIARPGGKADGRRYIGKAIESGAAGILTTPDAQRPTDLPTGVAWLVSPEVRLAEAFIAERFFGNPSHRLTLAGVTGTNGKTTVSTLIYQLLNAARMRCGLIGTVSVDDGKGIIQASMTTPPALELSLALSRMAEAGYKAAALEVSSHALDQDRAAALQFDIAIFTNLTGDHLDYHKTVEHYAAAKAKLFSLLPPSGVAIVNCDDPAWERMARDCRARVLRCSLDMESDAECRAMISSVTAEGARMTFIGPWGSIEGRVGLIGQYNAMNCLQAVAAAHAAGAPVDRMQAALAHLAAPAGRLELISRSGDVREPFSVLVDYSHTDDALSSALRALRPLVVRPGAALRVVFGCGGDKDRTKRPRMGRVACELADYVYVTSDNPRTENPRDIIREVLEGVQTPACLRLNEDPDRRNSIFKAIADCKPGDVLLVAGKGHEDYQILPDGKGGTIRIDFDDRQVVREALIAALGEPDGGIADPGVVVVPERENVRP